MLQKIQTDIFDFALTPKNAHERGYQYIDDVIYYPNFPSAAMMDILALADQHDLKLGMPKMDHKPNPFFGLYMQAQK